jgi:hypothetical protein
MKWVTGRIMLHLLPPLHHQLVVALHLVTGHFAPQAHNVGMVVAAGYTPMMGG